MGIIAWIVLGLIAGALAGFVMKGGFGILGDIVVGIVGALLGGFLYGLIGGHGVTGLNVGSIVIAFMGACILIAIVRAFAGRRVH